MYRILEKEELEQFLEKLQNYLQNFDKEMEIVTYKEIDSESEVTGLCLTLKEKNYFLTIRGYEHN